jgi:hypothetical protein
MMLCFEPCPSELGTRGAADLPRSTAKLRDAAERSFCNFPSFKHTEGNWDHLIDVLHLFRKYSLAVEVRHKTWADPLVLKALQEENVAFCNIEQTRLGETLEGTDYVTAPLAYLRLHGRSKKWFTAKNRDARYDYMYSKESMQKVKGKIEKMAGAAKKTFVVANNHPRGQAAANAVELRSLLSGSKVSAPDILVKPIRRGKNSLSRRAWRIFRPHRNSHPCRMGCPGSRGKARKNKTREGQRDLPLWRISDAS